MTDHRLVQIDAAGRWALATDAQQWIVASRSDGTSWAARKFLTRSAVLRRTIAGMGIKPTVEAAAYLDTLPETHGEWRHCTDNGRAAMATLADHYATRAI